MASLAEIGELTITELLARWPETAVVFHHHHMACVGCAVAPFYTVADAAAIYDLPVEPFLTELQRVIINGSGADHVFEEESV